MNAQSKLTLDIEVTSIVTRGQWPCRTCSKRCETTVSALSAGRGKQEGNLPVDLQANVMNSDEK